MEPVTSRTAPKKVTSIYTLHRNVKNRKFMLENEQTSVEKKAIQMVSLLYVNFSMEASVEAEVLIIGGGATGRGIARDLALRGIPSLLVEKGDINSGASGRNHGLAPQRSTLCGQ